MGQWPPWLTARGYLMFFEVPQFRQLWHLESTSPNLLLCPSLQQSQVISITFLFEEYPLEMKKFNELVETPQWLPVSLQGAACAWYMIVSTALWMLPDNGVLGEQAVLSWSVTRMNKEGGSLHHSTIWVCKAFSLETLTAKSIGGTNSQEESAPRAGKHKQRTLQPSQNFLFLQRVNRSI